MKIFISPIVFSSDDFNPMRHLIIQTSKIDLNQLAKDVTTCNAKFHIPTEDEVLEDIGNKIKTEFISMMKKKEYKELDQKDYRMITYFLWENNK